MSAARISMVKSEQFSTSPYFESDLGRSFKKLVVITWDGVRPYWMDKYTKDGTLSVTSSIREEGGETTIEIVDHDPSTNPGLTCIETGFGPNVTGIYANQFGVGSDKLRIPDGMTTAERLKEAYGDDFKTGHLNSWMTHDMNNSFYGLPNGHLNQEEMLDSIFLNAVPGQDVDYWFGSENITWSPDNSEAHEASYDEYWHGKWINGTTTEGVLPPSNPDSHSSYGYIERFSNTYQKMVRYWATPLINAHYLAKRANEFLELYSESDFYLRIHMTEPDHIGHGYFESEPDSNYKTITNEYLQSLLECDNATGKIRQKLIDLGIYEDTFVLIGTDHGFYGSSHDGLYNDQVVKTLWLSNQRIWGNDGIDGSYGWQDDIQPTILELAGVNISSIEYPNSKPVFLRYDFSSPEITIINSSVDNNGDIELWVKVQDRSGIASVNMTWSLDELQWSEPLKLSYTTNDLYSIRINPNITQGTVYVKFTATDQAINPHQQQASYSINYEFTTTTSEKPSSLTTSQKPTNFSLIAIIFAIVLLGKINHTRKKT